MMRRRHNEAAVMAQDVAMLMPRYAGEARRGDSQSALPRGDKDSQQQYDVARYAFCRG